MSSQMKAIGNLTPYLSSTCFSIIPSLCPPFRKCPKVSQVSGLSPLTANTRALGKASQHGICGDGHRGTGTGFSPGALAFLSLLLGQCSVLIPSFITNAM
jgi:hypothetical protein